MLVQTGKNKEDFIGLFFRNSNAQSPIVTHNADGTSTLSYITIGGIIEVYFFIHGSPAIIIQQYQNIIGHPFLPPFWSLGFQQGSYSYADQQAYQDMVDGYNKSGIPLEVVWMDIPYMDKFTDFTVDTKAFPTMLKFVQERQAEDQKVVFIIDAGISADDKTNTYYAEGKKNDLFVKSTINTMEWGSDAVDGYLS